MVILKRSYLLAGAVALLATGSISAEPTATKEAAKPQGMQKEEALPQADIQKVSEAFGHFIGRNLSAPGIKLDLDSIIKGLRDGAAGRPAPLSDKEYEALMTKLQETAYKNVAVENLAKANEFITKNAKESGVIVLEPGKLQYTILQPGNGEVVKEHDSPLIQYTGKYIDGTTFGSSVDAGGPITIPLDQTIPGFSKGILGMKEGEKRKLFVHPDLGYGTTGQLSPNALLIFEVEVIKANAPESDTDGQKSASLSLDEEGYDISDNADDEDDMDDDEDLDQDDNQKKIDNSDKKIDVKIEKKPAAPVSK